MRVDARVLRCSAIRRAVQRSIGQRQSLRVVGEHKAKTMKRRIEYRTQRLHAAFQQEAQNATHDEEDLQIVVTMKSVHQAVPQHRKSHTRLKLAMHLLYVHAFSSAMLK